MEAKYGYSSEGPFPARQGADVRATQGSVEPATPPHSPARSRATCSAEVPLTTPPRVSAAVVAAATAGISPSPPDTAHAGPQDAKEEMDSAAASLFSTSAYFQRRCSLHTTAYDCRCSLRRVRCRAELCGLGLLICGVFVAGAELCRPGALHRHVLEAQQRARAASGSLLRRIQKRNAQNGQPL